MKFGIFCELQLRRPWRADERTEEMIFVNVRSSINAQEPRDCSAHTGARDRHRVNSRHIQLISLIGLDDDETGEQKIDEYVAIIFVDRGHDVLATDFQPLPRSEGVRN